MDPEQAVAIGVKLTTDRLTDDEFAAVNIAAQLDIDPRSVMGYEKASGLFTCPTNQGYSTAHEIVKRALAGEALRRLGKA